MNYIQHLNRFFVEVEKSEQLLPTHISLYLALFQLWNIHHFQKPITATRTELMRVSKMNPYTVYYKCLLNLTDLNGLQYSPSHSVYKGSSFHLKPFNSTPLNDTGTDTPAGAGVGGDAKLVSINKHIQTL